MTAPTPPNPTPPNPTPPRPTILAVLVLYKMPAAASPAFRTLQALLTPASPAAAALELILCDNSPATQPPPPGFSGLYLADPTNPGLAACYNRALALAAERRIPWLLLLDQDTTLTPAYLEEVLAQTAAQFSHPTVVALVPRLVQAAIVQSPHAAPTWRHTPLAPSIAGLQPRVIYAFNSASVLRVAALEAIGGFPQDFWLDFLDHATFHRLQAQGGRVFVLNTELEHDLSANSVAKKDAAAQKRYANILDSEFRFYRLYGSPADRFYRRLRMLRGTLGQLLKKRRPDEALVMLRSALRRR